MTKSNSHELAKARVSQASLPPIAQNSPSVIEARLAPWCPAPVRVFVQRADLNIDLAELLRAARRYFDATIDAQSQSPAGDRAAVELHSEQHGYRGLLSIRSRRTTEHDLNDAQRAETLGRASGMAALAQRCPTIWDVESIGEDSELARLNLCAILASVALGPVLPDDGATLYGVRGAMERVERLLRSG